ncbi:hypothetical protein [Bacillus pumilus]|nr:hypothetical protein [Bacillus pumilus]
MKVLTSLFIITIFLLPAEVKDADMKSEKEMIFQTKEVRVGM